MALDYQTPDAEKAPPVAEQFGDLTADEVVMCRRYSWLAIALASLAVAFALSVVVRFGMNVLELVRAG